MNRPGIATGALVGALVTAPLIAVLYLAQQLAGLPFAPFDVFDWMARVLPGGVITFGIDSIVAAIRTLGLGELSEAAKTTEHILAIVGLFVTGVVAGAVLFGVLRRGVARSGIVPGLIVGVLIGVPVMWIGLTGAQAGTVGGAFWNLVAFLAWGAVLGWVYDRLRSPAPAAMVAGTRRPELEAIDRRQFLVRLGGASAAITVAGAGIGGLIDMRRELAVMRERGEAWSTRNPLPNADASVEPVPGTRPELTPVAEHYRIDINTRAPTVDAEQWRLRIGGLVEAPMELTLDELRERYPPMHQFITLSCISNPIAGDLIGTTRWTGASLQRVLDDVRPQPSATHLRIRAVDGFHEVVGLDEVRADPRIMLTYAWDGLPLPPEHGFPLRIYRPNRYGMKQPKWIESIEAIPSYEPGYWVQRGWDREAWMQATSVIDVVASNMMVIEPGDGAPLVPVGGIAHAGARGISRVELRVDDGPWKPVQLRTPLSNLTWVLWRFDWPFEPGEHTFTVRCFDGTGTPQVAERTPVRPDGATGLDGEDVVL